MSALTDRQRLELALPACLLCTLSTLPGAFVTADPALAARAEADIAELRANLLTASLEPFADLTSRKRGAVLRRLERVVKGVIVEGTGRSMLGLALRLWYLLDDLTEREVLLLWEGSATDRVMRRLVPDVRTRLRRAGARRRGCSGGLPTPRPAAGRGAVPLS